MGSNVWPCEDADAIATPPWPQALPLFVSFLQDWEPAIGVPDAITSLPSSLTEPRSILGFDHIFMAVHNEAALALLPYDTSFDSENAWVSQWRLSLLAAALCRNHVLLRCSWSFLLTFCHCWGLKLSLLGPDLSQMLNLVK